MRVDSCVLILLFSLSFGIKAQNRKVYVFAGADTNIFNKIFDPTKRICNFQRCMKVLKEELEVYGIDVKKAVTVDDVKDATWIVFFDILSEIGQLSEHAQEKIILFMWEPPVVKPYNYNRSYHRFFSKIFTWRDDWVDNERYFKLYFPQPLLSMYDPVCSFDQKKLCVMFAGHKSSSEENELYGQRRKTLSFFTAYAPQEFDLYGPGWPELSVYRGEIADKKGMMKRYKFSICYENAELLPGYITEKIFDCFITGCVPVYWGAPNITDYIPANCFIDRCSFSSDQQLYEFLCAMTEKEYAHYIENIKQYLASPQAEVFSVQHFVETFKQALGLSESDIPFDSIEPSR